MRSLTFLLYFALSACASLDRTDIRPGDRIDGPACTFEVPSDKSWFTVDYGTGNHIKLAQLNYDDNYTIEVHLNRGPRRGMYVSQIEHLSAVKQHRAKRYSQEGYEVAEHNEWIPHDDPNCVRFYEQASDWRGRNNEGPALVTTFGSSCPHPKFKNVLLTIELIRRAEPYAAPVDVSALFETVYNSVEFTELD